MDHNLNSGTKSVKGLTFHHFSTNQLARQFLQREKLVFGTLNFVLGDRTASRGTLHFVQNIGYRAKCIQYTKPKFG